MACQVLADDAMRAKYDLHGASGVEVNFMDAGVFFTMLFGSERFEPFIGTLALASAASMEGQLSMHRMQVRQLKREVDCALKLVALLQPYVDGDADGFRAKLQREAVELASVSFGSCLLFVVAEIYALRSEEFVGYANGGGRAAPTLCTQAATLCARTASLCIAGGNPMHPGCNPMYPRHHGHRRAHRRDEGQGGIHAEPRSRRGRRAAGGERGGQDVQDCQGAG